MAGPPSLAIGTVWHRRNRPTVHEFNYGTNQIWLDPDRPAELFDQHRLWSATGSRPVRFRRRDYFDGDTGPIGPALRDELAEPLGRRPTGAVRMLTQPRTWGWLFNPITVYLVWDEPISVWDEPICRSCPGPVGAVLEVTNTPWKERVRYAVALQAAGDGYRARFAKELHVSPFLDESQVYELSVHETTTADTEQPPESRRRRRPVARRNLEVSLDVCPTGDPASQPPLVQTRMRLELRPPSARAMTAFIARRPLATHRVSLGIHWQASRLLHKRVPFVPHPRKRP